MRILIKKRDISKAALSLSDLKGPKKTFSEVGLEDRESSVCQELYGEKHKQTCKIAVSPSSNSAILISNEILVNCDEFAKVSFNVPPTSINAV